MFRLLEYVGKSIGYDTKETLIHTAEELGNALRRLRMGERVFVDFISPSGNTLTMGVGSDLASAMFMSRSKQPPYLSLIAGPSDESAADVEFDMAGTPTPVPAHRLVPFDEVLDVATYFLRNDRVPADRQWEED